MPAPIFHQNQKVILFTNQDDLFPGYTTRRRLDSPRNRVVTISMVVPLLNEAGSLPTWLDSFSNQTRQPDELIFVDGGSQDASLKLLRTFASQAKVPVKIIEAPGTNISEARNRGIAAAAHPVIACTDLGGWMHLDWLRFIAAPFEIDNELQVVAGWYEVLKKSALKMRMLGGDLRLVSPDSFMPSSRSVAFTKEAWEQSGGYPEYPTRTGEDTLFNLAMKGANPHWAFVPEAVVQWQAPKSIRGYWEKITAWTTGDGELRLNQGQYKHAILRLVLTPLISLSGILVFLAAGIFGTLRPVIMAASLAAVIYLVPWLAFRGQIFSPVDFVSEFGADAARIRGFRAGLKNRTQTLIRKYQDVKGIVFILAGVPVDDIGGGPRCAQLSFEFLTQGYAVVYLHKFQKYESVPLNLSIYHPNLFHAPLSEIKWKAFWKEHRAAFQDKKQVALVEFPMIDFLPMMRDIRANGGEVIYDLLDDWQTPMGGTWYDPVKENRVIDHSQHLIATEKSLQTRLQRVSKRPVDLLPNAVNRRLFNPQVTHARPEDMPMGEWIAIYTGSLWGNWFDWELLLRIAETYPDAAVVVIGDYQDKLIIPPPNLHFMGLRPQYTLPAYLAHSDVTLIPRLVTSATQGMNPLKVYEYLAMHKPVVAPLLEPLRGIPGVSLTCDQNDFIRCVGEIRHYPFPAEMVEEFLSEHNWQKRVESLLALVAKPPIY